MNQKLRTGRSPSRTSGSTAGTFLSRLLLTMLLPAVLSGCGGKDSSRTPGIDGYVYVPQQVDLSGLSLENFQAADGYIYYRSGDYNVGTDLRRFPAEELLSQEKPVLPAGESLFEADERPEYIQDYTVSPEGCLFYLEYRSNAGETADLPPLEPDGVEETSSPPPLEPDGSGVHAEAAGQSYVLVKRMPDGGDAFCVSLAGQAGAVACGGLDKAYVLSEDVIYCIDESGRLLDRISVEDGWGTLLEGADGYVYYDPQDSGNAVFEITGDGTLKRLNGPCALGGSFAGSRGGLLYSGADGRLYRYAADSAGWETLLRWGDSNLAVHSNWEMPLLSEDKMIVCFPVPEQTNMLMKECYILTRTPAEELAGKQVLVMAGCHIHERMEQYVMAFNRSSETYHITIEYCDMDSLDAALVSSDPPDLINLTDMDYTKYGEKDVLENLEPWLAQSSLPGRENYPEAILDACTVKGRLVCIPDELYCTTVIGRTSQTGAEAGWTAADVMALARDNPQAELFLHNNFTLMIRELFRDYILGQYVDWENGECSFDGEEFLSFIQWVAEHSDASDSGEVPMEAWIGTMPGERLLSIWSSVYSLDHLLYERAYFGEAVTAVGYPTADGSVSHHGTAINHLGIVAASKQKEGAWQFIESFLSREDGAYTFLPARKDRLDEMAETLLQEEEPDSNERKIHIRIPDGADEYYPGMTREEMDAILSVIESADYTPARDREERVIDIIVEEMSPCLTGAKPYREAAAIVQNRVRILVQEEGGN